MGKIALSSIAALVVAVVVAWGFRGEPAPTGPSSHVVAVAPEGTRGTEAGEEPWRVEVRRLTRDLDEARLERQRLNTEVASLRAELARVRKVDPAGGGTAREKTPTGAPAGHEGGPRGIDVDALVSAGFAEETVRSFKQRVDQMELDRLYLRDMASREGWLGTAKFREQNEALSLDLDGARDEYGEEFYDWMLYTTGHSNRISVGDVMDGSAAADVGLQPGDQIVAYDDERIFNASDLRERTSQGDAGEPTPVDVMRSGNRVRVYIPRGPLGVRVEPARSEPDAVR